MLVLIVCQAHSCWLVNVAVYTCQELRPLSTDDHVLVTCCHAAGFIPPPSSTEADLAALGLEPRQDSRTSAAGGPGALGGPAVAGAPAAPPVQGGAAGTAFEQPGGAGLPPPVPKGPPKKRGPWDDLVTPNNAGTLFILMQGKKGRGVPLCQCPHALHDSLPFIKGVHGRIGLLFCVLCKSAQEGGGGCNNAIAACT